MSAKATVRYRVVWVIFFWPTAPWSRHSSSFGITVVRSWMMIELVMYGITPRPKMASRVSAPPENRFKNPRTPDAPAFAWSNCTCAYETPGTGMFAPSW